MIKNKGKSFYIISILCFIFSIIHFYFTLHYTSPYRNNFETAQNITYFISKIFSFIFIVVFYQCIPRIICAFKEKDLKFLNYLKFFSIYFFTNLAIIYLTFPYFNADTFYFDSYINMQNYYLSAFPHFFESLTICLFYNVIPTPIGINILASFLYSLIFAYCICNLLEKYKSKLIYLIFIPFFLPFILGLNQHVVRLITHSWILLFVFLYCYFNEKKENNKLFVILLFAVISSIGAGIRSENIVLVVILPLLILLTKIFTKNKIIVFTIILFVLTVTYSYINKLILGYEYQIHNLSYIYEDYILNNLSDKDIENNKHILNKIYKAPMEINGLPSSSSEYDLSDSEEARKAINCLLNLPLKNIPFFISNNLKKFYPMEKFEFMQIHSMYFNNSYECFPDYILSRNLSTDDYKYKFSAFLMHLNNKGISNKSIYIIFFSPFILLPLLLIYGIIRKRIFFINLFLFWLLSLFIILLYIHHPVFLYFFGFFQNVFTFSIIMLIEEINYNLQMSNNRFTNKNI